MAADNSSRGKRRPNGSGGASALLDDFNGTPSGFYVTTKQIWGTWWNRSATSQPMRDDTFLRPVDLDATFFACCGNQEPIPYKCSACGLPHVFCRECDTVYSALPDTSRYNPDVNSFDRTRPSHRCQRCGHAFEYSFLRNPAYRVTRGEWRAAGLAELLLETQLRESDAKLPQDIRDIPWRDPWVRVEPWAFTALLANQLRPNHPLYKRPVVALALHLKTDRVLFYLPEGPERLAVVHINWSPATADSPNVLPTRFFRSAREWASSDLP